MDEVLPELGFPFHTIIHLDVSIEELDRRRGLRKGREKEDTPEAFAMGQQKYDEDTYPVVQLFESLGMLTHMDGARDEKVITADLVDLATEILRG